MFDKMGMLGALGDQMRQMQDEVTREEMDVAVAGGKIKVRVNGAQEILAIRIDPALMGDREMLEDLLTAGCNEALRQSKEVAARKLQEFTTKLGLPPGLF
jgi:DNA-binding YbaB/EbfC family protein